MNVWDKIAESWNNFRQKAVREVLELKWKKGKILDIGCGNCRNLIEFAKKDFDCYGIDNSNEMLKLAENLIKKNKVKINLKKASAENLPFKEKNFDYCLSIANLHHLREREKSVKEIYRVLKKNGKALIMVWYREKGKKEDYIKWGKYKRYYYFFSKDELKNLLEKIGFKILKWKVDRNIVFLVRK